MAVELMLLVVPLTCELMTSTPYAPLEAEFLMPMRFPLAPPAVMTLFWIVTEEALLYMPKLHWCSPRR